MGKGSRVRASRRVGRPSPGSAGTSFGIGLESPYGADFPTRPTPAGGDDAPVPEPGGRRVRTDRIAAGLAQLEKLAAARAALRGQLAVLDEDIAAGVAHVRVDSATWVQVGHALGISRQGARQRFGGDVGTHRMSPVATHPHRSAP